MRATIPLIVLFIALGAARCREVDPSGSPQDEDDGGSSAAGSCFIQCPSEAWVEENIPDGGGYGQISQCSAGPAIDDAAECEAEVPDAFNSAAECDVAWLPDCHHCDDACAPEWWHTFDAGP